MAPINFHFFPGATGSGSAKPVSYKRLIPALVAIMLLIVNPNPFMHQAMNHTIRKKLKRYEVESQPRFLTFSCYMRLPLFDNDNIKDLFVDRLAAAREHYRFSLIAWVVMPEHIHLIIVPQLPQSTVSQVLKFLKQSIAKKVIHRWQEINAPILDRVHSENNSLRFWQAGGGYDRNIRNEDELREKINYIHANPVNRKLAQSPNDWNWSSSRWYSGIRDGQLTIDPWEA